MSQTETTAMQTTAIYNDDKTHRYLLSTVLPFIVTVGEISVTELKSKTAKK